MGNWPYSGSTPTLYPACRQALQAAALIATNIDELNQFLSHDLLEPIRFGIGIHGGEVIIGDIGYRDHQVFTALGDAVNVAARLQDMTKGFECEVILSEEVYKTAGLPVNLLPEQELPIRGRAEPMVVRVVANARMLSSPKLAIVAWEHRRSSPRDLQRFISTSRLCSRRRSKVSRTRQRRRRLGNSCALGTRARVMPRFKKHDRKRLVTG